MVYKFSQIKLIKELSEWMIHDIGASIDGGANYLTALGIASYCEILGSIYIGELGKGGSLSFNAFIDEMNPRYIELDKEIKDNGIERGLYDKFRCGLVHEYFIKGKSSIRIEKEESTLGIEYDRENNVIQINLRKLFSDFKEGINQILIKMKSSEKQKEYEITGISGDFLIKTYKEFFTK